MQNQPAGIAGYQFSDLQLLRQALTHRSYAAGHNERLEFLGDSVLNCVIAAELYRLFPGMPEGDLSRMRASLVNGQSLSGVAIQLNIGPQLLLGEGEIRSGGAQRPSMLADAVEALIGAVFLDGGFESAKTFTLQIFAALLRDLDPRIAGKDAKTLLQEMLQSRHLSLPQYTVVHTGGEAHEQSFEVECRIPDLDIVTHGEGASRRSAEQAAAQRAFEIGSQR